MSDPIESAITAEHERQEREWDRITSKMLAAGAAEFSYRHSSSCYPSASDWEAEAAAGAIYAAMEKARAASADTHPKDGDVQQAPLVSGAVPKADAQPSGSGPILPNKERPR